MSAAAAQTHHRGLHVLILQLLGKHDGKNCLVSGGKALADELARVTDGVLGVFKDNALKAGRLNVCQRQRRGGNGGVGTCGNLQRARGLGAIADHSLERCEHVVDCALYLRQVASLQVGHTTARARAARNTASAQGRKASHVLLDVHDH